MTGVALPALDSSSYHCETYPAPLHVQTQLVRARPAEASSHSDANDDSVYAVSASTGGMLWSATTGGAVVSSPAVANGHVYVGSDDGSVHAYALAVPPASTSRPVPAWLQPNRDLAPQV